MFQILNYIVLKVINNKCLYHLALYIYSLSGEIKKYIFSLNKRNLKCFPESSEMCVTLAELCWPVMFPLLFLYISLSLFFPLSCAVFFPFFVRLTMATFKRRES